MWAMTHYYNTACVEEGLYYFCFSLWDLLSLKERQVCLFLLSLPFFLCLAAQSLARLLSGDLVTGGYPSSTIWTFDPASCRCTAQENSVESCK